MFVGQTHRRRERLKERIKWRRKREDVPVQSNMPRHPQPEAEGVQRSGRRSGRGPGPRPGSGEAHQTDVRGDSAATLRTPDVDGKQTQQRGGAQTAGGVPELPLVVAARHGQEPDRHVLQVTSPVCLWMFVGLYRRLLRQCPSVLKGSHLQTNLLPWQPLKHHCQEGWMLFLYVMREGFVAMVGWIVVSCGALAIVWKSFFCLMPCLCTGCYVHILLVFIGDIETFAHQKRNGELRCHKAGICIVDILLKLHNQSILNSTCSCIVDMFFKTSNVSVIVVTASGSCIIRLYTCTAHLQKIQIKS